MALETGTFIDDLVTTNPVGATDPKSQGDDHLRLVKSVLKATLPNADRAFNLKGALGTFTETELTISSGIITPTGPLHSVDTEADAASDDLNEMAVTNISDGGHVLLRANNDVRTSVIQHNAGGATNPFLLQDNANFSLDQDDKWLWVVRRGAQWIEITRSYGSDAAAARAFRSVARTDGANTFTGDQTIDVGDTEANLILDAARTAAGAVTGDIDFRWNGNPIVLVRARTGDDTVNEDEGDLAIATANGGVMTERMRVHQEGGITVGAAPTGGQQGNGTVNTAGGVYKNGVEVVSGTSVRTSLTSSDATWSVPSGVKRVSFIVIAGGGGGDNDQPGGGGGCIIGWIDTDGKATLNITVGAAGAGAATSASNGGASSVSDGTFTFQANGGNGGDAVAGAGGGSTISGSPTSTDGEGQGGNGEAGSSIASGIGGKAGWKMGLFGQGGNSGNNNGVAGIVILDYVQPI